MRCDGGCRDACVEPALLTGTRHPTPQRLAWHATGDTAAACGLVLGAGSVRSMVDGLGRRIEGLGPRAEG
jgi:hypothetical protein